MKIILEIESSVCLNPWNVQQALRDGGWPDSIASVRELSPDPAPLLKEIESLKRELAEARKSIDQCSEPSGPLCIHGNLEDCKQCRDGLNKSRWPKGDV